MYFFIRVILFYLTFCDLEVSCGWFDDYPSLYDPWESSFDDYENSDGYAFWEDERRSVDTISRKSVVAGLDALRPIEESSCQNDVLQKNPSLSSPIECARTCHRGEKPKTCYYRFVVERYPVNGQACYFCTPNITNAFCSNCQCVPGDGVERMALTVNRMIPGPSIEVCLGDFVVIDVVNKIKGEAITIHWHGVYQRGYQYYDGVPYVTQCPILFHNSFRYQWGANNPGSYFWHAHTGTHKMDGVFGNLIVRQPAKDDPNGHLYEFDLSPHVLTINDWMHEEATERNPGRNTGRVGQLPDSILINGRGRYKSLTNGQITNTSLEVINVEPNRRYRFRLINAFCTVCPAQLTIQEHSLNVIATDGQPIVPTKVDSIISFAGERYDFVLETDRPAGAYWIQVRGVGPCADVRVQQLAILRYKEASTIPKLTVPNYDGGLPRGIVLNPLDGVCNPPRKDEVCISNLRSAEPMTDKGLFKDEPDIKLFLPVTFYAYSAEELYRPNTYKQFLTPVTNVTLSSQVDGISFDFPPVPPISQLEDLPHNQFCNSKNMPKNCGADCSCTHKIDIPLNAVVELITFDVFQARGILHPFHLHGYHFYVLSMGQPFNENFTANGEIDQSNPNSKDNQRTRRRINLEYAKELDKKNKIDRCFDSPPAKDTVPIPNNGFAVFRFRANNPGYWLFHCHFIYHQLIGMDLILHVGKQSDLPPVPRNFPRCGNFLPPIQRNEKCRKRSCYRS